MLPAVRRKDDLHKIHSDQIKRAADLGPLISPLEWMGQRRDEL